MDLPISLKYAEWKEKMPTIVKIVDTCGTLRMFRAEEIPP
jgi:hypothetical protein